EELLRKEKDERIYKRIKVIYLLKKTPNIQLKDVSEKLDISIQSVKKYWGLYRRGGIENLKLNYKGRIPILNKEEFEKFKEKAKEGFDSLKSMQEWIKKEYNKELSIKTISYWCKKLGIKKKGRPSNINKDENKVKEFKERRIKEIVENNPNARIKFYDESRFGLITDVGRKWTAKGIKPIISYQQKYEYFYLYQATDIKSGEDFSMYMLHLDSICFNEYLKNLSEKFRNDNIVLIMDNASFHKSKKLDIPKNIKIEYLPPYSPELNPQERRFEDIKKFLKNIIFKTIEELEKKLKKFYFHIQVSKSNLWFLINIL
ncbi:IS630 family transposase, partial [Caminibacter profundus]